MGKGDKKSKRGKIFMGTFGVRRPHGKRVKPSVNGQHSEATAAQEAPVKKPTAGAKKKS